MKASFFHYALSEGLSRVIPIGGAYAIGRWVADLVWGLSPRERRAVEENLRLVLGPQTPDDAEIRRKAREVYSNFSRYCVDLLYYGRLHPSGEGKNLWENLERVNPEALDRALRAGRGALVVSAHLGNWELGAMALAHRYPVSIIAKRHSDERVDSVFMKRRRFHGVLVIPAGFAFRPSLRALGENRIVALNADREFSKKGGIPVDFLGIPARLPRGPAAISRASGTPVVGCFMVPADGPTRYRMFFEGPLFPNGDSEEAFSARIGRMLEDAIRKWPTQWFVFENFKAIAGSNGDRP